MLRRDKVSHDRLGRMNRSPSFEPVRVGLAYPARRQPMAVGEERPLELEIAVINQLHAFAAGNDGGKS